MCRRTLLGLVVAAVALGGLGGVARAEDPPAPTAPAGAVGLLIANKAAGFTAPLEKKGTQALFRGLIPEAPAGPRVFVYLLPAGTPAQEAVLEGTVGWTEVAFERQAALVEATLGRPLFKRTKSSAEVLAAVAADPGGVGIVTADTLLSPAVVVLWPPPAP